MTQIGTSLSAAWRLAKPYFQSGQPSGFRISRFNLGWLPEKWVGRGLLAVILAINVAQVVLSVLLNQWNGRFYNALQAKDLAAFTRELGIFSVLAAIFIALAVYELYLTQWLVLRWRTWMTHSYLDRWTDGAVHYRMRLSGDKADNPDQRIADDIQMFAANTLGIGVQLFSSFLSLAAFAVVLWGLSSGFPLKLAGHELSNIPGYLVWMSFLYATLGTYFAHAIGRPLAGLNAEQQRREANFRFGLVRLRENAEPVALMSGEAAERRDLKGRFTGIIDNTLSIMRRRKLLTFFSAGYQQVSVVAPFLLLSPAYFSGGIGLGSLTQTAGALGNVQGSLSIFISLYATLAEYQAVIARLSGFDGAIEQTSRSSSPLTSEYASDGLGFRIHDVVVRRSDGTVLLRVPELVARPGDHILISGPTGAGKTTALRALAGLWPHASGRFDRSPESRVVLLPQYPYIPWMPLRDALLYPESATSGDDTRIAQALRAAGLEPLIARIDENAPWHRILSGGEAQRLAIARLLLQAPSVIFLDEATSAIDEDTERTLYAALYRALPSAVIVSIGHRTSLAKLHNRLAFLRADGGGGYVLDVEHADRTRPQTPGCMIQSPAHG